MIDIRDARDSVAARVIRSFRANAFDQAVTIIVQLAGIPILLAAWGAKTYGEWLIIATFPAYFSLVGLGLSQSAGNDMTARVARGDVSGAAAIYRTLRRLVWSIIWLALLGVVVLALLSPLKALFDQGQIGVYASGIILASLCAEAVVAQANGVTHAAFRTSGRDAFHVSVTAIVRLTQYVALWATAVSGGGPMWSALMFLLVRLVGTTGLAAYLHRTQPWLAKVGADGSHASLRPLLIPALANLTFPLGLTLSVQGIVLAIGSVLGPVAVVTFSTARTLTRFVLQAIAAISNSVEPELARAHGAQDSVVTQKLVARASSLAFWLSACVGSALLIFGPLILSVWTHGIEQVSYLTLALLVLTSMCSVFWYVGFALLKSRNLHLPASILFLACSASAVALGYTLLSTFGSLLMCAAAILMGDLLISAIVLAQLSRVLNTSMMSVVFSAVSPWPLVAFLRKLSGGPNQANH